MKLKLCNAIALLLISTLAQAGFFEEKCKPPIFEAKDGLCQCNATGGYVNVWNSDELYVCKIRTQSREICLDKKYEHLGMSFVGGRCFCPANQEYASEPNDKGTLVFPGTSLPIGPSYQFAKYMKEEYFPEKVYPKFIKDCENATYGSLDPNPLFKAMNLISLSCSIFFEPRLVNELNIPSRITREPYKPVAKARTAAFTGERTPGLHGGYLETVEKIGETWFDGRDFPDLQGDPRWASSALGPKLAEYFGFRTSSSRITVPDDKEITNALHKLAKKKIQGVGYYKADGLVGIKEYLQRLIKKRELPISGVGENLDQTSHFHDLSYHFAGLLLMPPEMLDLYIEQAQSILNFEKFLEQKYPALYKDPRAKIAIERLLEQKVKEIDVATGHLTMMLDILQQQNGLKIKERTANRLAALHKDVLGLIGGDKFRLSYLAQFSQKSGYDSTQYYYKINEKGNHTAVIAESYVAIPSKSIPHQELIQDALNRFLAQEKQKSNPNLGSLFDLNGFIHRINHRRMELEKAAGL